MIGANHASSSRGVVAAGSPFAAEAGARVLREGGNAADAAVATALALAATDPANNSLFGRCQIVVRASNGECHAIDGASQAPAGTPPRARIGSASDSGSGSGSGEHDRRERYRVVPVPGLPGALEKLHRAHGRLALARVAAPAAELAEIGFEPPEHLSQVWAARASELRTNAPAREAYLGCGDTAPTRFRHARLAALIRAFGERGAAALTQGALARELAQAISGAGGYWTEHDLAACAPRDGEVLRGRFRDCEIVTVGRQAWGHTLVQMLSMLDALPRFGRALDGIEAERLLLTFLCALSDRPQAIGTLEPKTFGLPYETLVDRAFTDRRASLVQSLMAAERAPPLARLAPPISAAHDVARGAERGAAHGATSGDDPDTTHLSVIDAEGASVAMTCSIGPHFGARVADPVHGVLLAHSYRMASDPRPGARDETEMSPVIVTRSGALILSLGAAGSERIPGAIAQVIVNVIDRELGLADALAFPRVNVKEGRIRLHEDVDEDVARALHARGYDFARSARGHLEHLGVVHACGAGNGGEWVGAADPAWDGDAAAP